MPPLSTWLAPSPQWYMSMMVQAKTLLAHFIHEAV